MCDSLKIQKFPDFNHLLTTSPHDIREVFISDLHLTEGSPLFTAFLALLNDLSVLPNLQKLYILGDWFDVWIGDDEYLNLDKRQHTNIGKPDHWITPIVDKLKKMRINGCQTFVLTGNRDFLMRQPFCNAFAGTMLKQPHFIQVGDQCVRLEHGDALCTDDKSYQKFRKYAQNPIIQWWLLNKSLDKRQKIADKLRSKSKEANQNKSLQIMDVNATAVQYAFAPNLYTELIKYCKKKNQPLPPNSDILIHGHTHRPAVHKLDKNSVDELRDEAIEPCLENIKIKTRFVLGDWRLDGSGSQQKTSAVIGAVYFTDKVDEGDCDKSDISTPEFGLFNCVYQ